MDCLYYRNGESVQLYPKGVTGLPMYGGVLYKVRLVKVEFPEPVHPNFKGYAVQVCRYYEGKTGKGYSGIQVGADERQHLGQYLFDAISQQADHFDLDEWYDLEVFLEGRHE